MNWTPWRDYSNTRAPKINYEEPPCRHCKHWCPHVQFDKKGNYDGVIMCIADKMYTDFSCYEENKEK